MKDRQKLKKKVDELKKQAKHELDEIDKLGGLISAIETGYMKKKLVHSQTIRQKNIESGEQRVVGVNCFTEGAKSPLMDSDDGGFMKVDQTAERNQIKNVMEWKEKRDKNKIKSCLKELSNAAKIGANIMEISIKCAHAGVTTGEWGKVMREIFGEYRAPTGIAASYIQQNKRAEQKVLGIKKRVDTISKKNKKRPKMLVGKPGLDGHSNGAEQIAVRARDVGFEVVYDGIRSTPEQLVNTCVEESIDIIGLSILSGSHIYLVKEIKTLLSKIGLGKLPVVVGGIIPPKDENKLMKIGVKAVFTPKNFQIEDIMSRIVEILE